MGSSCIYLVSEDRVEAGSWSNLELSCMRKGSKDRLLGRAVVEAWK